MTNKTMMRVPKELLEKLKKKRISNRESYAEVVSRMLKKETSVGMRFSTEKALNDYMQGK